MTNTGPQSDRLDRCFRKYQESGSSDDFAHVFDLAEPLLRSSARRWTKDPGTLDDLIQVTLLAVIKGASQYQNNAPVIGWMRGILKNQAAMWHRRESRREAAIARQWTETSAIEFDLETPEFLTSSQEVDLLVSEAIDGMNPSYQSVMRLAVLHGLKARDIAKALDRPEGSIRTQLVRGREILRSKLPATLAGVLVGLVNRLEAQDLAQLKAGLVFEAGQLSPSVVASSFFVTLMGGLTTMKLLVPASLGLLMIAAAVWQTQNHEPEEERIPLVSANPHPPLPLTKTDSEPQRDSVTTAKEIESESPADPTQALELARKIQGRVLDQKGIVVKGAMVAVWPFFQSMIHPEKRSPAFTAYTNEHGEFALDFHADRFTLRVFHEEGESRGFTGRRLTQPELRDLEITLHQTVIQEGTLSNHKGEPVPDYPLGHSSGSSSGHLKPTEHPGLYSIPFSPRRTRTDDEGRFHVQSVPTYAYLWTISHPTHVPMSQRHRPQDGPLNLVLERGESLRGYVYLSDGSPAVGAMVSLLGTGVSRRISCDGQGQYGLHGISGEELEFESLLIDHPNAAIYLHQPLELNAAPQIHLEAPASLSGRVVDKEGYGLKGVQVKIVGERSYLRNFSDGYPSTWEHAHDDGITQSDETGHFEFPRLYPGLFQLSLRNDEGHLVQESLSAPSSNHILVLSEETSRSVNLKGSVHDAHTQEPLAEFSVTPMLRKLGGASDDWRGRSRPGKMGQFSVLGLEESEGYLSVKAEGYALWIGPEERWQPGTREFDIHLYPSRTLTLRAEDEEDSLLSRCRIRFFDLEGKLLFFEGASRGLTKSQLSLNSLGDGYQAHRLPAKPIRAVIERTLTEPIEQIIDLTAEGHYDLKVVAPKRVFKESRVSLVLFCSQHALYPEDLAFSPDRLKEYQIWGIDREVHIELSTLSGQGVCTARLSPDPESNGQIQMAYRSAFDSLVTHFSTLSSEDVPQIISLPVANTPMKMVISSEGYEKIIKEIPNPEAGLGQIPIPLTPLR